VNFLHASFFARAMNNLNYFSRLTQIIEKKLMKSLRTQIEEKKFFFLVFYSFINALNTIDCVRVKIPIETERWKISREIFSISKQESFFFLHSSTL
jgi:hypothetical protein